MRMPGFQDERIKILHDAMKWKAPKTYADLKKAGILWEVLVDREQEMMDIYSLAMQETVEPWKRENQDLLRQGRGLEFLAKHRQLIGKITDEILDTFTEFSDPPEDDKKEW
jgi:hypothetical protein